MKTLVLLAALSLTIPAVAGSSASPTMTVTAYCLRGVTATGTQAGPGTIAVDPAVIPLHRNVWVQGYGWGRSADTGSAIRGRHVDVWMPTCTAALEWGVRRRVVVVR